MGPFFRAGRLRSGKARTSLGCGCYACRRFSRAYLRHLVTAGEILAGTLLSLHNLHFFVDLMAQARARLKAGDFADWHKAWISRYESGAG